jgi:hypothetical protein
MSIPAGTTFGRLTVLGRDAERSANPRRKQFYRVRCVCGVEKSAEGWALGASYIVSCGCKKKEHSLRHGKRRIGSKDPTYQTWDNMIQRCTNPNREEYPYYGGRGIAVCERWKTFANFLADMGERPDGTEIERERNEEGYLPGNCVWATRAGQMLNTRRTHIVIFDGEALPLVVLARRLGLPKEKTRWRHRHGWSLEEIINNKRNKLWPTHSPA